MSSALWSYKPPAKEKKESQKQPRSQGPPREKLPTNDGLSSAHAEGPGDEVEVETGKEENVPALDSDRSYAYKGKAGRKGEVSCKNIK